MKGNGSDQYVHRFFIRHDCLLVEDVEEVTTRPHMVLFCLASVNLCDLAPYIGSCVSCLLDMGNHFRHFD